jgi:RNA polymerase sigma factor (sigma-70 family)
MPPDAELLDRFRRDRDDEAFAALVRRHGPAVLAACRQVLSDPADVDDAFQAAFLVLLRRVATIDAATVGSWLYAVAHRVAVRARSDARRRAERERAAGRRTEDPPPDPSWREAVAVLHEELDRLPAAYRRVLLLCYLSGRSREEAAADLGWTAGAVKGRLERGRRVLAARLARRGIVPSVCLLAVVAGNPAGAGGPTPELTELAIRAAAGAASPAVVALSRGVTRDMFISKLKPVLAAVLGAGVVLATAGLVLTAGQPPAPPAAPDGRGPAPEGLIAATPEDIIRAYFNNDAAGDERYLGKRVRLTSPWWGVVSASAGPGGPGGYLLVMEFYPEGAKGPDPTGPRPGAMGTPFAFRFGASSRPALAALKFGQPVTVEGVCAGRTGEAGARVTFTDCKIVDRPNP